MATPETQTGPARPPELLAPAGGWPQLRAAIESGADAVYFGLSEFNARARAANFTPDELPDVMAELHRRGVQGFVAFNTLIFDEELATAAARIERIAASGVDALIVQDLGAVRLIRAIAPDLPLHASTQMTVTSAEGCNLAQELGIRRVVLARELSIAEIGRIARATPIELEVFVHGALCVSYSGQCYSSEAWGGRSANRGQCAQACRLPYDLILDGASKDLGPLKYLLSPQDLMAVDQVPALIATGVACFKIEGRLKGPEYVALTTQAYRKAIDAAWSGAAHALSTDERRDLTQIFSRGLTPGFLEGVRHQRLVEGRAPRHRGLRIGRVQSVAKRGVVVELEGPVKRGDGLVFDAGRAAGDEAGGRVYEVFRSGKSLAHEISSGTVELRFGPDFPLSRVAADSLVWRTRDEALEARIRSSYDGDGVHRRSPVDALVRGRAGEPLTLVLRDDDGREGCAATETPLQPASRHPLDEPALREQLGRLGDTPLVLRDLQVDLGGALFLPRSALSSVRREATNALLAQRACVAPPRVEPSALPGLLGSLYAEASPAATTPELTLLCRSPEQVSAACDIADIHTIYLDFLEVKGVGDAVREVQRAGKRAVAASPRILKVDEERIWRFMINLGADGLLVRSLGLLQTLTRLSEGPPLYGDFSLNAANALTASLLLERGLERITPTHDLNAAQLCALARQLPAHRLELIVHHHLPIFHTEHCVFARFLSNGNDFRDCGAPCERHRVHLRDGQGRDHLVLADMGCRNTVFNAEAQSGARWIPDFLAAGYRTFRIELVDQDADAVAPLVAHYRRALDGQLEPGELWRWLDRHEARGVTAGSLVVRAERTDLRPTAR